jgi:hypothetical protein
LANGVIGDTNWDGVYLGFGDVPNGNAGGAGNGSTTIANANNTFGSFLTIRTSRGDWAGAGDDGFFLWKLVSGDFDMSVQSAPPWNPIGSHFGGVLVRAWNTNNSGGPVSFNSTNATENWLMNWRFQEFSLNQVRQATNGADIQNYNYPDSNSDTNTPRYFRIVRTGDVFTFYWRTNNFDSWALITNNALFPSGSITRDDWNGHPVQVGIAEATFSANAATAFYTDFELTGPNVGFGGTPPADPSGVTSSLVNSNTVHVAWTPGSGSDGSLVLIRNGGIPNRVKPIHGITYTANNDFKSPNNLFGGNSRVVFAGAGSGVDITGLGGSNNTYTVAIYSYTGSGPSITYGLSPATNNFGGPGTIQSVFFGAPTSTNIPASGIAPGNFTVTAVFSSGDSIDVTADPQTVWVSSDPTVAVATNGVITGITNGTASIHPVYANVSAPTNLTVSVYTPAFVDTFTVPHNYASNGVTGSKWDGAYFGFGDVPKQIQANSGGTAVNNGSTPVMDSNLSTNNALFMRYSQTGFEGNESDGNFLWKIAVSNFQAVVHIKTYDILAFNFVGLMARQFTNDGGPFGTTNATFTNGRENHTRWTRFDEFGISTSSRQNVNGGNTARDTTDGETDNYWLLMVRSNTTFFMYKKALPTDPWKPITAGTSTIGAATNPPMQVGISANCFANNNRTAQFDYFMLDAANIVPFTAPNPPSVPTLQAFTNSTITLTWTPGAGSDGSVVVMRALRVVNVAPQNGVTYTGNSSFGLGDNLGSSNYVVFVGSGSTVTVSNLIPGVTYYAAVFSFSGAGTATVYNSQEGQGNVIAQGQVSHVDLLPIGTSPVLGGVGFYTVQVVYTSGVTNDVTAASTLFFSPPEAGGYNTNGPGVYTPLTNTPFNAFAIFSTISGLNVTNTNNVVITTHNPVYVDNFDVNHDYLANDVRGTIYDGVYFGDVSLHPSNSIPGDVAAGSSGPGNTLIANANISSNGVLTVQHLATGWEFTEDDGFLLLKNINGNFQTSIHVLAATDGNFPPLNNANVGLMARAAASTNGGNIAAAGESWVSWSRFDLFGIQTDGRSTLAGATTRLETRDGSTNYWLLLVRQGNNILMLERPTTLDPWLLRTTTPRGDFAGVPLQVGIQGAMFSDTTGTTLFDHFMLDGTAALPRLQFSHGPGTLSMSWPTSYAGYQLQSANSVGVGSVWSPVTTGTTVVTNGVITVTEPTTSGTLFYRLTH